MLLAFLVVFSNVKLIGSPLPIDWQVYKNAVVLYFFNFLTIVSFSLVAKRLTKRDFYLFVNISAIFLLLSILASLAGIDIHGIFGRRVRVGDPEDIYSPLGFRVAGYAEDVNYASLCMIIWFYVLVHFKEKKIIIGKKLSKLLAVFGYLVAFSKTIFLAIIYWVGFEISRLIRLRRVYILMTFVLSGFLGFIAYNVLSSIGTMRIRFIMWRAAFQSIEDNPILGLGITGVRANFKASGGWYVQPHNNFIAIAADHGLIALVVYFIFIVNKFYVPKKFYILMIFFLLLSVTQDLWVFPYPVFVMFLIPLFIEKETETIKYTLIKF